MRVVVAAVLAPIVVATLVGLVALWPRGDGPARTGLGLEQQLARGTVATVTDQPCPGQAEATAGKAGEEPASCRTALVRIEEGPGRGKAIRAPAPQGAGAPELVTGDRVVLTYEPRAPVASRYQITDFQRGQPLALLAIVFAVAVVAFARWRGLAALGGLVVSFAVLLGFVLPAILAGSPPVLVAVVGAAVIMLAVLYLTHGISVRTSVAVIGTMSSLALTGALGLLFTATAKFTGLAGEEAATVGAVYTGVDVRGLLLAGIVIGSLGVLDDVTVTQAATVTELSRADPGMSKLDVYRAAARVGREHVASTVNTLVLAYAGASLPLLLLFSAGGRSVRDLVTNEAVAQEVVRSAVGSIGIVAAVPITTALAVALTVRERAARRSDSGSRRTAAPTRGQGRRRRG